MIYNYNAGTGFAILNSAISVDASNNVSLNGKLNVKGDVTSVGVSSLLSSNQSLALDTSVLGNVTNSISVDASGNSYTKASPVNVKHFAFGATGNGVTNDSTAIQAAINYAALCGCKRVKFPAGTYLITTGLNLTELSGWIFEGDSELSTTLMLSTSGKPGIDMIGSNRIKFMNMEIMAATGTAAPNVGLLMGRDSSGASAGWHRFENIQFQGAAAGSTFLAMIYQYGSEINDFKNCELYVYNAGSIGVFFGGMNELNITSQYQTIATGQQSSTTFKWDGGHLADYSALTTTAPKLIRLNNCRNVNICPAWMCTSSSIAYIHCWPNGAFNTVDTINVIGVRCEAGENGNPVNFINCEDTSGSIRIGTIMGNIFTATTAIINTNAITHNPNLYLGIIMGNNFNVSPTYMII